MSHASSLPPELDIQLEAHCERTAEYFSSLSGVVPVAVVLGGGYGRGEGGVRIDASNTPHFFNDLDYFIFTDTPEDAGLLASVKVWEREESKRVGIDVEGKCLPLSDLSVTATSMMFFDLVSAHRVVFGPPDILTAYQGAADSETIAPIEATRLLWNRGTGLLFARMDLDAMKADLSVAHRNQAKAKLALGDALLTIRGQYAAYVSERHGKLLEQSDVDPRIVDLHAEGTSFKLRPTAAPSYEALVATQEELTALWRQCFLEVESVRLGTVFDHSMSYAYYRGKLFPESSILKNCLLALRDRIKRGGGVSPVVDYPRGALQRSLLLLLEPQPDFRKIGQFLGIPAVGLQDSGTVYQRWWEFYS